MTHKFNVLHYAHSTFLGDFSTLHKKIMRCLVFICLTIGLSLHIFPQIQDYVFEPITSEAGITFNAVNCMVTDDNGFLWFGTASGLYYYNSAEIIQYSYNPLKNETPPSNRINNLYKDHQGRIWICTDQGLCYFDELKHSFSRLDFGESGKIHKKQNVSHIVQYNDDEYLLAINRRIYHFNLQDLILRNIKIGDQPHLVSFLGRMENDKIYVGTRDGKVFFNQTANTDFSLLYQSSSAPIFAINHIDNHIWLGFGDAGSGVEVINSYGKLIATYKEEYSGDKHIASNRVRKIVKRKNGEIWIGTAEGISVIDSVGVYNINQHLQFNGLPHISIFDLYVDQNDGVWAGTWSGGLAYYSEYAYKFPHIRMTRDKETVSRSIVSSFAEDEDGSIWVGVENANLKKFNPETMTFISDAEPWPVSRIKGFATDQENRHWIGTLYKGLWTVKDNQFERKGDISGIFASVLAVDDGVWIGTRTTGLIFYDTEKDIFTPYKAGDQPTGSISSNGIWKVFQDSREHIWVCSNYGLSVKYKGASDFENFFYHDNINSLSRNLNYTITEDQNGKLWIGTAGAGIDIYDPTTKTFQKFHLNASIENAEVYCILEDQQDNMWFSTNQGIYVYYPQTNQLRNFTEQDGILGMQYHPNAGFISSAGKLFFGGGNGFNMIDPKAVKQNPRAPEVFLSKLLINNKPLDEQKPEFINAQFPTSIHTIELASHQNSLSIGLVANSIAKSSGNKFRYRMKDYLNDWIETNQGNDVVFTKIPPGNYTLEVLSSNSDGVWVSTPKEFHIKIAPPFWLSWYAFLFYGLIVITSSVVIFRELRFREKSRADKILFSEKVKFFTNVSHEFRTPLTLIISPLNNLIRKFEHDPSAIDHMKIIKRNADRLLNLTSQVLDFRLIELNKIKLRKEKADIVSLCRNAYDCFEYEATEKQINCVFSSSFASFQLQMDAEKMEKVVYNLLSNGLKHSYEKGQIILSIEQKVLDEISYSKKFFIGNKFSGNALEIKVKDSGRGIKKNNIPLIFQRFFVDHENEETGLGIGLHMCQEYIQLHGGNIMVTSEEGNGAVFSANIPIEQNTEFKKEEMIIQYHFDKIASKKYEIALDTPQTKKDKFILYVEDNDELRIYFKNLLSTKYKVLTAKNGLQALNIARETIPDVIISDILMPGMDGLELTDRIRKSKRTNDIPIILLTALTDETYKIESMSKGANAFITKPVDDSFLFARIENILGRQETIKKKIEDLTNEQRPVLNSSDSFIENAKNIVEKNLQNPSFSIAEFAAQLHTSRSSLQRKMKAELSLSPTEFIRDFRLNRAIELMKLGTYNIDEIGLLVGFNSTSYFIRTFKKKYGKTPYAFQSEVIVPKK